MSSYFDTLDRQGKDRYQRKLEVVGLSLKDDPFTAGTSEKWHSDMVNWPKIEYGHIFAYFISRPGTYMQEQLRALLETTTSLQLFSKWLRENSVVFSV